MWLPTVSPPSLQPLHTPGAPGLRLKYSHSHPQTTVRSSLRMHPGCICFHQEPWKCPSLGLFLTLISSSGFSDHRGNVNSDWKPPEERRWLFIPRDIFFFFTQSSDKSNLPCYLPQLMDSFAFYSTVALSVSQVCIRFLVPTPHLVCSQSLFSWPQKLLKPKPFGYKDRSSLFLFQGKQSVSSCLPCGTVGQVLIWALKYFPYYPNYAFQRMLALFCPPLGGFL